MAARVAAESSVELVRCRYCGWKVPSTEFVSKTGRAVQRCQHCQEYKYAYESGLERPKRKAG